VSILPDPSRVRLVPPGTADPALVDETKAVVDERRRLAAQVPGNTRVSQDAMVRTPPGHSTKYRVCDTYMPSSCGWLMLATIVAS
jgi:hypothetical protein